MKKRFLAMLVLVAMLAATLTPIGAMATTPEVTKTYFDIDFENWTNWGDNSFNGGKNSDGSAISHEWGANPWQMSSTTVSDRSGTVMKAIIPTSGGSNYLFRSRMKVSGTHPSNYTDVDVLWNEFSIKYEVGFVGFGTNENDEAKSIISINKNGQLALGARWGYNEVGSEGNFEAGTLVPNCQLELNQWYNIKVAADFTDASAGVLAYVWVNGELIAEGITIPNFQSGTNWVYNKLYFDQAETACTAYIDDVKVYETAELGDITAPDDSDDSGDTSNTPAQKINDYFDIDFENWTTWGDNSFNGAKNSDGSAIGHEWGANPWQMSATTVSDRIGNVMKAEIPTSGGSNYLLRSRMKATNHPSSYSNIKVLWNEFAIKYEGGFVGFGTNENDEAKSIISINKNGQLALGARWGYNEVGSEGNFEAGTIVTGGQLELGKWYNIAVATDFTDKNASSGVPAYVWVNGEKIADGTVISNIVPGTGWIYNKLYFDQASTAGSVAYIDDVKVYETDILDTHIEDAFKVTLNDENSDDYITLDGTNIKTPSRATLADVKASFPGVTFKFEKDGESVTDDTMSVSGVTAYVYSPNGLVSKAYTLSPDSVLYTISVEGSYAASSGAGEYSVGDAVTISAGSSEGQKFTGWTTEGIELDDSTQNTISFIMDAGEKAFIANWESVPTYAVEVVDSFAQNSGAGQYYEGQDVAINAGEREGYTFGGWIAEGIENVDTTSETIEFVMDTVPKKFTAIWNEIPKYKVTISGSYAADSGAGEWYAGATVTINAGDTKKAEFKRWNATGVTISNASSAITSFEMPANDVSITATWSSYSAPSGGGGGGGSVSTPSFKINFETNGGSLVDAVSAKKGSTITLANPTKEDFSFDGWYLDSSLTQKVSSPYEVSGNVTLYAKWADKTDADSNADDAQDDDWLNPFNDVKAGSWYFEPIKYMYQRQYCEGFGWGQFGPDVNLSRAMLVTILYRIEEKPAVSGSSTFTDIEDGSWYEDAVVWAAENGIVTGYNSYSFAPDDLITREQIAAILYRYAQLKGENVSDSADISAFGDSHLVSSYAHSSLGWAVAKGYLNGRTETTIAPADYATRAEALTVLYRFIKK